MKSDLWTVVAIAVVVYAVTNVVHEGAGHGLACLAVGGDPEGLNAVYFDCNKDGLSDTALRVISAAGSLANLVLFVPAWFILRMPTLSPATRWAAVLCAAINLLQPAGYFLFSGIGGFGDWANVVRDWPQQGAWRVGMTVVGALAYYGIAVQIGHWMAPLSGGGEDRGDRMRALMLPAWLAGGILYVVAGMLNPVSVALVLVSAAAASFGGTSALVWIPALAGSERYASKAKGVAVPRSPAWMAAGVITAMVFVGVLGPTVPL